MSDDRPSSPQIYSQLDVSTGSHPAPSVSAYDEQADILREVLVAQDRTNELLEELIHTMGAAQKQRAGELNHWKSANPGLADSCREAAEALSRVQLEYLERVTEEIGETAEDMSHGDFVLNEFVDRVGPRLAHLNGVIQVLAQLSSVSNPTSNQS